MFLRVRISWQARHPRQPVVVAVTPIARLTCRRRNVSQYSVQPAHWNAGRSQMQIHQSLNIDRKTIRKYLAPALAEGLAPVPDEVFDEQLWRARQ
jgi:hypothetical protein